MSLRFLSRDRAPAQRITHHGRDVRVVEPPAEEMPPRPQLRRPDPALPPVTGGAPFATCGGLNAEFDPCGGPPLEVP